MKTQRTINAIVGSLVLAVASLAAGAAQAETGKISYYGAKFAGRTTASGEKFNPNAMTMAHRSLPFGSKVRVTNAANKRSVMLRVNDRGPSVQGRVADVSHAAARKLAMTQRGVVPGKLTVVRRGRG